MAADNIRAFTGMVTFADIFGRPFKTLRITYDSTIPAGGQVSDSDKGYEPNQFMDEDKQLMTTKLENMKVTFQPASILLADGTQLGSAN